MIKALIRENTLTTIIAIIMNMLWLYIYRTFRVLWSYITAMTQIPSFTCSINFHDYKHHATSIWVMTTSTCMWTITWACDNPHTSLLVYSIIVSFISCGQSLIKVSLQPLHGHTCLLIVSLWSRNVCCMEQARNEYTIIDKLMIRAILHTLCVLIIIICCNQLRLTDYVCSQRTWKS